MKTTAIILIFIFILPCYAFCESQEDILTKIEAKMMQNDFHGAQDILKSSIIRKDRSLFLTIQDEIDSISSYSEKCADFFSSAKTPGEEAQAIASYELLVKAYDFIPKNLHFSEKYIGFINSSVEQAKQFVNKKCGDDYGQIRVGMKLSRIQKCVGEFSLRGQVKGKYGVVDHYTRLDTYLFVKNGKVVAWGDY